MKLKIIPHMYPDTDTCIPFKGCRNGCIYCKHSFQRLLKMQKHNCPYCYNFDPHYHFIEQKIVNGKRRGGVIRHSRQATTALKREYELENFPNADIVFICSSGDISFCDPRFTHKIIDKIKKHNKRCSYKTYYFQSKNPVYFKKFLSVFPENVILLTTLETNRDSGYRKVSKATLPLKRYSQFLELDYPRKVVTIEPVMDFDLKIFSQWIIDIAPEYVWLGYNSRPRWVELPEPFAEKLREFVRTLSMVGIKIRPKKFRGIDIGI